LRASGTEVASFHLRFRSSETFGTGQPGGTKQQVRPIGIVPEIHADGT
jgi:hypothetical protein